MSSDKSYAQILKASSIMGGAAGIKLLLGMVQVKSAAVLIGATGVGLNASFTAIQGLIGTLAGLGIQSSAVRDIAAAVGRGDQQALGRSVLTLRRICWLTGLAGMAAMLLLSPLLSQLTFGHRDYTLDIAALGLIVLFANLSSGQMALIQGTRRIGNMARANIYGAATGTLAAIGFYATLGLRGIVPALVTVSALQLALSWFFARQVPVPKAELTLRQTFAEAKGMVRLGAILMLTSLLSSGVTYYIIALITKHEGIQAVGIYGAAFALSGIFVNFVLGAMGADYYPRLISVTHDNIAMNRMANEQTEIGLLLAIPGLLATVVLAPWIVQIFYSDQFIGAVNLIHWFILGCLGRVLSWPLGYFMLALGKGKTYGASELSWSLSHLILVNILFPMFGLEGIAAAFFILYVIVTLHASIVAKRLTGFVFSRNVLLILALSFSGVMLYLVLARYASSAVSLYFGFVLIAVGGILSAKLLASCLPENHRVARIIRRFI